MNAAIVSQSTTQPGHVRLRIQRSTWPRSWMTVGPFSSIDAATRTAAGLVQGADGVLRAIRIERRASWRWELVRSWPT